MYPVKWVWDLAGWKAPPYLFHGCGKPRWEPGWALVGKPQEEIFSWPSPENCSQESAQAQSSTADWDF